MKKILLLIVALLPFAVFGLMYFSMKFFPSYEYNSVDIRGLYEAEKGIFGFIPCEYFAAHHNVVEDIIAGVSYLCWVPVPIAFAVVLFFQKRYKWCIHFTLCFLLCNILGFCIYYAHPAAPPWYVLKYGFDLHIGVPGNVGGLVRFDELTGIPIFKSIYSGNSNVFAAVPSLHAAYMLIATIYAILSRQTKTLTVVFALITLGIWFTAVYSGHHYVIDVTLGIITALAAVVIFEKALMKIPLFRKFTERYEKILYG